MSDPYLTRAQAAETVSTELFPVSARQLRAWPKPATMLLNGYACARRSAWLGAAKELLEAAERDPSRTRESQRVRTARARAARPSAAP